MLVWLTIGDCSGVTDGDNCCGLADDGACGGVADGATLLIVVVWMAVMIVRVWLMKFALMTIGSVDNNNNVLGIRLVRLT